MRKKTYLWYIYGRMLKFMSTLGHLLIRTLAAPDHSTNRCSCGLYIKKNTKDDDLVEVRIASDLRPKNRVPRHPGYPNEGIKSAHQEGPAWGQILHGIWPHKCVPPGPPPQGVKQLLPMRECDRIWVYFWGQRLTRRSFTRNPMSCSSKQCSGSKN